MTKLVLSFVPDVRLIKIEQGHRMSNSDFFLFLEKSHFTLLINRTLLFLTNFGLVISHLYV